MRIPEDEKIRLAFEQEAFHTIDPEFRKEEVWQKIQEQLFSNNKPVKRNYLVAVLILLVIIISGGILSFKVNDQLKRKNFELTSSIKYLEKSITVKEKNIDKSAGFRKTNNVSDKAITKYSKNSFKRKADETNRSETVEKINVVNTMEDVILKEQEPNRLELSSPDNQTNPEQQDYIFSFNAIHQQIPPHELNRRKIKIQFLNTRETLNSEGMKIAGILNTSE